ncbi:MAG TPA: thioesterase family protein, partial [Actinomycetes bacterium]|nr:thioesterase family protein [Actinomycetes bacterium]
GRTEPFFPTGQEVGYHTAMELRFVAGSFLEPGPATAWMRMRHPLLPGEAPSPLSRVLVAADSGNGVAAALDYRRWLFINTDLTVYLTRPPAGEWVALEATTTAAAGIGLADTALHDEQGPIGRAVQALFVDRR